MWAKAACRTNGATCCPMLAQNWRSARFSVSLSGTFSVFSRFGFGLWVCCVMVSPGEAVVQVWWAARQGSQGNLLDAKKTQWLLRLGCW